MEISNMKSYKLNKTFENSIYPLEQELKEINNNTVSNALNNLVAIIFSGIGTSILLDEAPSGSDFKSLWFKSPKQFGKFAVQSYRLGKSHF